MNLPGLEEKYEIIRPLGEGGMGVVYLALQKPINRKVAIKSIAPYLARDPAIRERFAGEAAVLARLNHPNIVTLYDYIEEEKALYLVMEYVEGQSLSDLLKAGPLPMELLQKYFSQVLDAFAYAHDQGVIHRDIKPANIMITAGGRVKILDFGVARILQTDHSLTRTGMRLGTLMYMSPEQIRGEKDIDHRSDIYSLGVVLYEMLTAQPPYPPDISEFDLSLKIVQEPLFDLSHPPAVTPARLIEVILKATEKRPDYRYQHCKDFLGEFEEAFSEAGVSSSPLPPTQIQSAPSPKSLSRRISPLVWIGILVGSGLGVGAWFIWKKSGQSPPPSDTTLISTPESTLKALNQSQMDTLMSPSKKPDTIAIPHPSQKPTPTPASHSTPKVGKKNSSAPSSRSEPQASLPPPERKPLIQTEIQNFKGSSFIQPKAKGTIIVRNVGQGDANLVQIAIHFMNKKGEVEYTDTLTLAEVKAGDSLSRPLQARVNGIKSLQVEVITPRP